jgi:uncharacterized membrane protein
MGTFCPRQSRPVFERGMSIRLPIEFSSVIQKPFFAYYNDDRSALEFFMTVYAIAYAVTLTVFVALDAIWLSSTTNTLYRPVLGDILADHLRIAPAVAFYFFYPLGIVIFAVAPALKAGSFVPALVYGALFGLFAYATYELTNFATLRNWTLQIVVIDILWGAFVTGVTAALAYFATALAASSLGLPR